MPNNPPPDNQGGLFDASGYDAGATGGRLGHEQTFATDERAVDRLRQQFDKLRTSVTGVVEQVRKLATAGTAAHQALRNTATGGSTGAAPTAASASGAGASWGAMPRPSGPMQMFKTPGYAQGSSWQQIRQFTQGTAGQSGGGPTTPTDRSGGSYGGGRGRRGRIEAEEVGAAWYLMRRLNTRIQTRMDYFGQLSAQESALGASFGLPGGMFSGYASGLTYPGSGPQALQIAGLGASLGLVPGTRGGNQYASSINSIQAGAGYGITGQEAAGTYASIIGNVQTSQAFRAYGGRTWAAGTPLSSTQIFDQVLSMLKRANSGHGEVSAQQLASGRQPGSQVDQWLMALGITDPAQKDAFFQYALQKTQFTALGTGQTYNPANPFQQQMLGLNKNVAERQRALETAQGQRDVSFYQDQTETLKTNLDIQKDIATTLHSIEHSLRGPAGLFGSVSSLAGSGGVGNLLELGANARILGGLFGGGGIFGRGRGGGFFGGGGGTGGMAAGGFGGGGGALGGGGGGFGVPVGIGGPLGGAEQAGGSRIGGALAKAGQGGFGMAVLGGIGGSTLGSAATPGNPAVGGLIGGVGGAAALGLGIATGAGILVAGVTGAGLVAAHVADENARHNKGVDASRDYWYALATGTRKSFANAVLKAAQDAQGDKDFKKKLGAGKWEGLNTDQKRDVAVLVQVAREFSQATNDQYTEAKNISDKSNKSMDEAMKALNTDLSSVVAARSGNERPFISQVISSIKEWSGQAGTKRTNDLKTKAAQWQDVNSILNQYGVQATGTGDPPDAAQTARMNPAFRSRLNKMMASNPKLQLNSGWRGTSEQSALYKDRNGVGAVMPGNSMHEKGLAADLGPPAQYHWIQQNAARFGLQTAAKYGEPHHVQLAGTLGDPTQGISQTISEASTLPDLLSTIHNSLQSSIQTAFSAAAVGGGAGGGGGSSGSGGGGGSWGGGSDGTAQTGATASSGAQDPQNVAKALYNAGFRGQALAVMLAVSNRESGFRIDALGDRDSVGQKANGDTWGPSVGLFQIRTLQGQTGTGADRDISFLTGSLQNQAKAAYDLYQSSGFSPWYVTNTGAVDAAHQSSKIDYTLHYLPQASQIVQQMGLGDPPAHAQMSAMQMMGSGGAARMVPPIVFNVTIQNASEMEARRLARSATAQIRASMTETLSRRR